MPHLFTILALRDFLSTFTEQECARNGLTTRDVPMIVVGNKCDNTEQPVQVQTSIAQRYNQKEVYT